MVIIMNREEINELFSGYISNINNSISKIDNNIAYVSTFKDSYIASKVKTNLINAKNEMNKVLELIDKYPFKEENDGQFDVIGENPSVEMNSDLVSEFAMPNNVVNTSNDLAVEQGGEVSTEPVMDGYTEPSVVSSDIAEPVAVPMFNDNVQEEVPTEPVMNNYPDSIDISSNSNDDFMDVNEENYDDSTLPVDDDDTVIA